MVATTTTTAAAAEEFSQSIRVPSSTHPGTTYPVRTVPHSDIYTYITYMYISIYMYICNIYLYWISIGAFYCIICFIIYIIGLVTRPRHFFSCRIRGTKTLRYPCQSRLCKADLCRVELARVQRRAGLTSFLRAEATTSRLSAFYDIQFTPMISTWIVHE